MKYDEYVGIGICCEIGFVIQKLGLSMVSYPFDWGWTPSIKDVCTVIKDDFQQFNQLNVDMHPIFQRDMHRVGNLDVWLPHYDGNFGALQDKINNFRKLIKSEKRVLFIYKSHLKFIPDASHVQLFIDTIKSVSNIIFDVLIVNECVIGKTIDIEYPCFSRVLYGNEQYDTNLDVVVICYWDNNTIPIREIWTRLLNDI